MTMAIIRELKGDTPVIGARTFLAENASLIGSVKMGEDCSIWYGAVLRGDVGPITLGNRVNIQDNAVLHATTDVSEVIIGNDVLIGMGAVIMDNAVVPDGTVVAAGAVVLANTVLEPGIWAGVPAKKVKDASEKIQAMAHDNAQHYLTYKEWYE